MEDRGHRELIDQIGIAAVAERYVANLRVNLDRVALGELSHDADEMPWFVDAVIYGVDLVGQRLDPQIRLQLIVAAAEAAANDDEMLWCIGDQPADHLIGDAPEMAIQLHCRRAESSGVARMFTVMQNYCRDLGLPTGWWADE